MAGPKLLDPYEPMAIFQWPQAEAIRIFLEAKGPLNHVGARFEALNMGVLMAAIFSVSYWISEFKDLDGKKKYSSLYFKKASTTMRSYALFSGLCIYPACHARAARAHPIPRHPGNSKGVNRGVPVIYQQYQRKCRTGYYWNGRTCVSGYLPPVSA